MNRDVIIPILTVIFFVLTTSCQDRPALSLELCDFFVPADSSSLSVSKGPDFQSGSFLNGEDTINFYCGSFPDLGMTLHSLLIQFPSFAIDFEKRTKQGQFNFVKETAEPKPLSIERNQKLVDEYGIHAEFPETIWDTLKIYQANFESHSAWLSVPSKTGVAEIVLLDSTLASHSTSPDHSRPLRYNVLALYLNDVSLRDTTEIFEFIKRIK